MKTKHTFLTTRKKTGLLQKDVAYVLHQESSQYNKIEKSVRPPNLDIIISFQILFGKNLKQLFPHRYQLVKERLINRSKKRIIELQNQEEPQRGIHRIAYLQSFINGLHDSSKYGK